MGWYRYCTQTAPKLNRSWSQERRLEYPCPIRSKHDEKPDPMNRAVVSRRGSYHSSFSSMNEAPYWALSSKVAGLGFPGLATRVGEPRTFIWDRILKWWAWIVRLGFQRWPYNLWSFGTRRASSSIDIIHSISRKKNEQICVLDVMIGQLLTPVVIVLSCTWELNLQILIMSLP